MFRCGGGATPRGASGLPFVGKDAALARKAPSPLETGVDTAIRIDARAGSGIPAPARVEALLRDGSSRKSVRTLG